MLAIFRCPHLPIRLDQKVRRQPQRPACHLQGEVSSQYPSNARGNRLAVQNVSQGSLDTKLLVVDLLRFRHQIKGHPLLQRLHLLFSRMKKDHLVDARRLDLLSALHHLSNMRIADRAADEPPKLEMSERSAVWHV